MSARPKRGYLARVWKSCEPYGAYRDWTYPDEDPLPEPLPDDPPSKPMRYFQEGIGERLGRFLYLLAGGTLLLLAPAILILLWESAQRHL